MAPLRPGLAGNRQAIAEPVIVVNRTHNAPRSAHDPVPCLNTGGHVGVAAAFLLQQQSGGVARPVAEPAPTVATKGAISLVEPVITDGAQSEAAAGQAFLIPFNGERTGQAPRSHSVDEPLPTVTTGGAGMKGLAQPYLVGYYGNGRAHSVQQPIGTLTAKDRYGLVTGELTPEALAGRTDVPVGALTPWGIKIGPNVYLDIRFRMLKVHELAAAMGFPTTYQFLGTVDDQVKQIGNAVSVEMAEALCGAVLAP
jgi:DNA (cytosine-5)-methyltransferase 1